MPDKWAEVKPTMQGPQIRGYRELSDAEIAMINRVKAKAEEVAKLIAEINEHIAFAIEPHPLRIDPRWLAIGQTDLQKGFMAVVRAIARPEGF